jgi:hypothetical protein
MYFSCRAAANKARTAVLGPKLNVIFSNRVRLDFGDLCVESGELVHIIRNEAGVDQRRRVRHFWRSNAQARRSVVIPPPKPRIRNKAEVASIFIITPAAHLLASNSFAWVSSGRVEVPPSQVFSRRA